KQMNDENKLFEDQRGIMARTIEDEIKFEQDLSDKRKAILDEELKSKLISQTEYQTAIQNLENDSARMQAELAMNNLQRELKSIEDRIDIERAVSKAVGTVALEEEEKRFNELQEARARFALVQFEQGLINEQEYQDSVAEIRTQNAIREAEFAKERLDLEKKRRSEQLELDLESQMLALEAL